MVKRLSTMWEIQVRSLGWEDPLEKEMAIHSSTIAWKIPKTEEPGRLQSMGSQRVGHDWATSCSSFIIGDWNANGGSQEQPGVTGKFGLGIQNEAGQKLIEFCKENSLVIANSLFQQYKRRLYTWTWPDGQHWNQIDYILCSQRWRSSIQSAKTRPGADCGSDHELVIAKFRLKLKKVGKTTRPFRYDLNQIPYVYTVKVRNRFKGLDLIDRVPNELWMEVCDIVQETGIKTILMEKKCKKRKMAI